MTMEELEEEGIGVPDARVGHRLIHHAGDLQELPESEPPRQPPTGTGRIAVEKAEEDFPKELELLYTLPSRQPPEGRQMTVQLRRLMKEGQTLLAIRTQTLREELYHQLEELAQELLVLRIQVPATGPELQKPSGGHVAAVQLEPDQNVIQGNGLDRIIPKAGRIG